MTLIIVNIYIFNIFKKFIYIFFFCSRLVNFINIHLFHDDDNIVALQAVSVMGTTYNLHNRICEFNNPLPCSRPPSTVEIVKEL